MLRFAYQAMPVAPVQTISPGRWAKVTLFLRGLFGRPIPGAVQQHIEVVPSATTPSYRRPLVPVRIPGPVKARRFRFALMDTGSVVTVFPADAAPLIGVILGGRERQLRWRGQSYPIEFQTVELELEQAGTVWRWRALVGFTSAPLAYPLLGLQGCLEFMDARFHGADQSTGVMCSMELVTSLSSPAPCATRFARREDSTPGRDSVLIRSEKPTHYKESCRWG
jgi:hypothetical protein